MMAAVDAHQAQVGVKPLCDALGLSLETYYRQRRPKQHRALQRRRSPARALTERERQSVLDALHSERFGNRAPTEVYATLLDEGVYLASPRTMYRILAGNREVRERRNQLRHPMYAKPELLATGPNQVWTWDITKLLGRRSGRTIICTSYSTFSAATLSVGCSRGVRTPSWRVGSFARPAPLTASSPANSPSIPTAEHP